MRRSQQSDASYLVGWGALTLFLSARHLDVFIK